jgi:hypothetical protein
MSSHRDVPLIRPDWSPRRLSAAEVVRLVQGDAVPGVDDASPVIQLLRRGLPGNLARGAFAQARRQGYLFVNQTHYADTRIPTQLRDVWGWWCAAAGHPEVTLSTVPSLDAARVRCDLSPTGQDWSFGAFAAIGKLVEPLASYEHGSWLFTTDELQLDGIEMDEAVHIARALVDLGTMGRFREGVYDEGPAPSPRKTAFPSPMPPIERTAG